jgi:hypothetical protein
MTKTKQNPPPSFLPSLPFLSFPSLPSFIKGVGFWQRHSDDGMTRKAKEKVCLA